MKRAGILGLVMVLTLALGTAPTQAKPKRIKVDSAVTIEGYDDDVFSAVTFFGKVSAEKPKCARKRRVDLEQITDDLHAGSDKSDAGGDWEITFDGNDIPAGDFQATVVKRKIKRKRNGRVKKVFICKQAVSPVFEVL
jgi:hypothetical protein